MRSRWKNKHRRLNKIWGGMLRRCQDIFHDLYRCYGGRGITVCDEWAKSFDTFYEWAITEGGYSDGLTIERVDNNKGYSPANCKFITRREQGRNKQNTVFLSAFGEIKSLPAWAEDARCAVKYHTLYNRLFVRGWDVEEAIITPNTPTPKPGDLFGINLQR